MSKQRRSIWLLALLLLACTGAALVTLTAAEQKSSATATPATAAAGPPAGGAQPAADAKPQAADPGAVDCAAVPRQRRRFDRSARFEGIRGQQCQLPGRYLKRPRMNPFAIELDDRAVCLARAGRVLSSAPSAVFDGSAGEAAGVNAWHALRRHPTATSTRHLGLLLSQPVASERAVGLVAAELAQRLAEHSPAAGECVWIVAPARAQARGLGTALGVARSLPLAVDGFVDAAAVSVAALGLEREAIVLELGMH